MAGNTKFYIDVLPTDGTINSFKQAIINLFNDISNTKIEIQDVSISQGAIKALKSQLSNISPSGLKVTVPLNFGNINSAMAPINQAISKMGTNATATTGAIVSQKAAFDLLAPSIRKAVTAYESLKANSTYRGNAKSNFGDLTREYEELMRLRRAYYEVKSASSGSQNLADKQKALDALTQQTQKVQTLIGQEKQLASSIKQEADAIRSTTQEYLSRETLLRRSANLQKKIEGTAGWTASQKGRTSANYNELQKLDASLKQITESYNNGQISAEQFKAALSGIQTGVTNNITAIQRAGEATKSFGDRMKGVIGFAAQWFGTYRIMMMVWQKMKDLAKASIELDTAFTQLQIVTRASDADMEAYGASVSKTAREISSSITDLVDSTTTFARLGYNIDESSELAKYTAMLKNVGDIEVEDAQSAMTSIIKAFDVDATQIEQVMDKLVKTGNNFPISVSEIATGMNNASSALHAAGNSFEESVALLTAANTTVQNASKSSTGLRTIAARIRNTKTELDELGEEPLTSSKYEELVQQLSKYQVKLTDVNGEYRSTYSIIKDLASAWDEMGSMEQAAIATALAGTRQQDVFFSLVGQFQEASNAMEAMEDSAGELDAAYSIHLDSIQAHIDRLKAAFQGLGADVFSAGSLKGLTDIGTGALTALDFVTRLVDKIGTIPALLAAISGINAFRGGSFLQFSKTIKDDTARYGMRMTPFWGNVKTQSLSIADQNSTFYTTLNRDIEALRNLQAVEQSATATTEQLAAARDRLSRSAMSFYNDNKLNFKNIDFTKGNNPYAISMKQTELSVIAQNKSFSNVKQIISQYNKQLSATGLDQKQFSDAVRQSNQVLGAYIARTNEGSASMSGYVKSLVATKVASIGLRVATMALNMALSMGIGMLISYAFNGLKKVVDYFTTVSKSFNDRVKDIRQSMSDISNDIQEINSDYQKLNGTFQEVVPRFAELSKGVDALGNNMSLTEEEYKEYWELNNKIAEMFPELSVGMDSNGNAMLNLSSNADSLTASLQELLDVQRQLANEQIAEKMPEVMKNAMVTSQLSNREMASYKTYMDALADTKELYDELKESGAGVDEINYALNAAFKSATKVASLESISTTQERYSELFKNLENYNAFELMSAGYASTQFAILQDAIGDAEMEVTTAVSGEAREFWDNISKEFQEAGVERFERRGSLGMIHKDIMKDIINFSEMFEGDGYDEIEAMLQAKYGDIQKIRDSIWRGMAPTFTSWAQLQDGIPDLSKELQDAVSKMVGNIDYGNLESGLATEDGIKDYITNHIINPMKSLSLEAQADLSNFFTITPSDKTIKEYINSLKEQLRMVADESDFAFEDLLSNLGVDKIESEYRKNANLIISRLKNIEFDGNKITKTNALGRILGLSNEDFEKAVDAVTKYGVDSFQGMIDAINNNTFTVSLKIEEEVDGVEAFNKAISESRSEIGLTDDSLKALKDRYKEIKGYDPNALFERTAHGIHLNVEEYRRLEAEYARGKEEDSLAKLEQLKDQYNELTKQISETTDATEQLQLMSQRDEIYSKIEEVSELASMYDGLTSSYNNWLNAQKTTNENDMFINVSKGIESTEKLWDEGWHDIDEVREFVQLMTDENLSTKPIEYVEEMYEKGLPAMKKYFTGAVDVLKEGSKSAKEEVAQTTGLIAFLEDALEVSEKKGKPWVTKIIDENGNEKFKLDFGIGKDEEFVKAMNELEGIQISTEQLQILLRALDDTGFAIHLDSDKTIEALGLLSLSAEDAVEQLKELGLLPEDYEYKVSLDKSELDKEIEEVSAILNQFSKDENGIFEEPPKGWTEELQNQRQFGNIDLDNRQVIEWNKETIRSNKDALNSWEDSKKSLQELVEEYDGMTSTVFGSSGEYDGIEIAFSPMLQTEHGAKLLSSDTVDDYIFGLIDKAGEGWKSEDLIRLDAEGLEIDGEQINNLIAEIGENARLVGDGMHFNELDYDGLKEAKTLYADLLRQRQSLEQPAVMTIDTSELANSELADGVQLIQDYQDAVNNLRIANELNKNGYGIDTTEIENGVRAAAGELKKLTEEKPEIAAQLKIDSESVSTALDEISSHIYDLGTDENGAGVRIPVEISEDDINAVDSAISNINPDEIKLYADSSEAEKKIESIDEMSIGDKIFNIIAHAGDAVATIINIRNLLNSLHDKTTDIYVNKHITTTTTEPVGTASANGTAYASGDWRIKGRGTALGGELGREIVVRDGRWFTIGDNGAEFFHYEPDDIIFNHEQTEQLLKNGKIINGNKRGNAFVGGTAFSSGGPGSIKRKNDDTGSVGEIGGTGNVEKDAQQTKQIKEDAEDAKQTIDWIEVALSRIQRKISNLKTIASSAFKTLGTRLKATNKEIKVVSKEIELQRKAFYRYKEEANSVGLSEELASLVRNGTIDIREYDEETQKLISDYKQWYEKALECKDAIGQLNEELSELYLDNFNNTKADFDNRLGLIEHISNTYDIVSKKLEAKGRIGSTNYFSASIGVEEKNIRVMRKELNSLVKARDRALKDGTVKRGSEEWYNMQKEINGTKEAIDEARLAILEYRKAQRELKWEFFDFTRDQVANVIQENDFLLDMMDNKSLYLTSSKHAGEYGRRGKATEALRVENYRLYMEQANAYARSAKQINEELAKDPNNTDLLKRRQEMIKLQQESIKSAQSEKEAIRDLVEGGIKLQLENLKKIIDTHKDALDSAKDLYEYQKKIADKTKNIASIQKQLTAYRNDGSEETKATVQKLKVQLEEAQQDLRDTEYDKFVSDSKKLLDDLYSDYEETLNSRLDDIDALLKDAMDNVTTNAHDIEWTIGKVTEDVGYSISENNKDILDSLGDGQTMYSAVHDTVKTIMDYVQEIKDSANNYFDKNTENTTEEFRQTGFSKENGNTYYLKDGKKQTGWQTINGKDYYFNSKGEMQTGLTGIGKHHYFFNEKGQMVTGWQKEGKNWYYMGSDGVMKTGWQKIKDDWFYLDKKTGAMLTGWQTINNKKYYLDSKGVMQTGWQKVGGNWYYLDSDGSMMTGWQKIGGKWYYFDKNGIMVTGAQTINGKKYNFSSSGVWDGKAGIKAYATGGLVDFTGLAKLDGSKSKPELVLKPSDTKNFLALRDSLRELSAANNLKDLTGKYAYLAGGSMSREINVGDTTVNISIDHVEDYNDFVNQLRADKKFEKLVQSITIDRVAGKGALIKNNYSW